jgi:hypothetical protein
MEQDAKSKPISQLTDEEWEQVFGPSPAAAEAKAQDKSTSTTTPVSQEPTTPGREQESSHSTEAAALSPQTLELGSKIWEMRKRGLGVYEIHRQLALPMESVKEILAQFEKQFYPDVGLAISSRLALDDARLDHLFQSWLPIATGGPIAVTKTDRRGQQYTEMDVDTPARAAGIVLTAIQRRIQLALACRPEGAMSKDEGSQVNIITWLQTVMPGVEKVINAPLPREELVLECAAETDMDLASETSRPPASNWNGSNR